MSVLLMPLDVRAPQSERVTPGVNVTFFPLTGAAPFFVLRQPLAYPFA